MIYIKKSECPNAVQYSINQVKHSEQWKKVNGNPKRARDCFDMLDKESIRESLLDEQHGLCAYCMKRITVDNMKIEHWKAITSDVNEALDYKNFAGCCDGGSNLDVEDDKRVLCCDSAKGNQDIKINPWNKEQMALVSYTKQGRINITDEELQKELDYILQLNGEICNEKFFHDTSTQLIKGRKDAYDNYKKYVEGISRQLGNDKKRIANCISKRICELESRDEYEEFIGVTLYFLKRKLRHCRANGSRGK